MNMTLSAVDVYFNDRVFSLTEKRKSMTLKCVNPSNLPTPLTHSHVVIATDGRLVFVAGQVAEDCQGNRVGHGDMTVQARQVFANIGRALAAAGTRPPQVTLERILERHFSGDGPP